MKWRLLAVLVVAALPGVADAALVTVALPSLTSSGRGALVVVAYAVGFCLARRGTLRLGLGISTLGYGLSALGPSLLAGRLLAGVGGGLVLAGVLAAFDASYDPAGRARALAVWAGFIGLTAALAPLLSGLLVEWFGPGSIFVAGGLVAAVALLAAPRVAATGLPLTVAPLPLAAFFGLGGTAYILSFQLQTEGGLSPSATGLRLMVLGVVLALVSRPLTAYAPRSLPGLVVLAGGLATIGTGWVLLPMALVGVGAAMLVLTSHPRGAEPVVGTALGAAVLGPIGDLRTAGLVGAAVVLLCGCLASQRLAAGNRRQDNPAR